MEAQREDLTKGKRVELVEEESTLAARMEKMEIEKLPERKRDNTARPLHDNAKPTLATKGITISTADFSKSTVIMTTMPPRDPDDKRTREEHPDGFTECLLFDTTKRAILDTPGFPQALKQPSTVSICIKSTPTMGFGVFATRTLDVGDLIVSERPLMFMPHAWAQGETIEASMSVAEEFLRLLLSRMVPSDREAFLALENSHKEDGGGQLFGIIRTNGFGVIGCNLEGSGKIGHVYSAVFDKLSRINHSCRPNVKTHYDAASFSYQLYALRPIAANEELFLSYVELLEPAAIRRQMLESYGFQCKCESCSGSRVAASDKFRTTLEPRVTQFVAKCQEELAKQVTARRSGRPADAVAMASGKRALESAIELLKDMEREGLYPWLGYGNMVRAISVMAIMFGHPNQRTEYASRMAKLRQAFH